jgi:alpha-tubulin suppressor-like RCC1 family protein
LQLFCIGQWTEEARSSLPLTEAAHSASRPSSSSPLVALLHAHRAKRVVERPKSRPGDTGIELTDQTLTEASSSLESSLKAALVTIGARLPAALQSSEPSPLYSRTMAGNSRVPFAPGARPIEPTFSEPDVRSVNRAGDGETTGPLRLVGHLPALKFRHISAAKATRRVLVVTNIGQVFGAGANAHGALGLGPDAPLLVSQPVAVPLFVSRRHTVIKVACGTQHSMFLTGEGRLFASGRATYGRLGVEIGHAMESSRLRDAREDSRSDGLELHKGVLVDKEEEDDMARFGGVRVRRSAVHSDKVDHATTPIEVPVPPLPDDEILLAGFERPGEDRLSRGAKSRAVPKYDRESRRIWVDVDAGDRFTVAVSASSEETGPGANVGEAFVTYLARQGLTPAPRLVYSWGDGSGGRLGLSRERDAFKPMLVEKFARFDHRELLGEVESVCCGVTHTLALTSSRRVFAWGDGGGDGRLGLGSMGVAWEPEVVVFDGSLSHAGGEVSPMSRRTTGPSSEVKQPRIRLIAAGAKHSLASAVDGALYAWGHGSRLGVPGWDVRTDALSPVRLNPPGSPLDGVEVRAIAAGAFHSAVVLSDGRLFTWGEARGNSLGFFDGDDRIEPEEVACLNGPAFSKGNRVENEGDLERIVTQARMVAKEREAAAAAVAASRGLNMGQPLAARRRRAGRSRKDSDEDERGSVRQKRRGGGRGVESVMGKSRAGGNSGVAGALRHVVRDDGASRVDRASSFLSGGGTGGGGVTRALREGGGPALGPEVTAGGIAVPTSTSTSHASEVAAILLRASQNRRPGSELGHHGDENQAVVHLCACGYGYTAAVLNVQLSVTVAEKIAERLDEKERTAMEEEARARQLEERSRRKLQQRLMDDDDDDDDEGEAYEGERSTEIRHKSSVADSRRKEPPAQPEGATSETASREQPPTVIIDLREDLESVRPQREATSTASSARHGIWNDQPVVQETKTSSIGPGIQAPSRQQYYE